MVNHTNWTEYVFRCTNNITDIDPVTGDEEYALCHNQNRYGDCELYEEPKTSWFRRFFEKLS